MLDFELVRTVRLRLTHGVLVLGGSGPADREGVGVHIADLLLGLSLGLVLRGGRPPLGHRPSIRPILFPMGSGCPVDHGHPVRTHQPLE